MLDHDSSGSESEETVDSAIFSNMYQKLKNDLSHEIPIVREKYVDVLTIFNPDQSNEHQEAKIVFLVNEFNSIRATEN